jgi:uncharacterized membrane protein
MVLLYNVCSRVHPLLNRLRSGHHIGSFSYVQKRNKMCCKNHEFTSVILFPSTTSLFISNSFDYIYNFLFQTFKELIHFYIYIFCLVMEYHTEKKTENCIIVHSACCKVSVIFRVITYHPTTNPSKINSFLII